MSDNLKKFISDNRKEFDTAEPNPQLLKKLQDQLHGNSFSHKKKWTVLKWAAAIAVPVLLAGILYFTFQKKKDDKTENTIAIKPAYDEATNYADPVYAKQIYHFKEIIVLQQNELKRLEKEYPQLYHQFNEDIDQLDSSYQTLKTNLTDNPNREMLLEAMIQNLQLQSELLNRQLLIIKEIKQKNKRNEKTTI